MTKEANDLLLLDLNFKTALLEVLDWDENQFDILLKYLHKTLNEGVVSPSVILEHVACEHSDAASDFIKEIFIDVYIKYGFYIDGKGDYEH